MSRRPLNQPVTQAELDEAKAAVLAANANTQEKMRDLQRANDAEFEARSALSRLHAAVKRAGMVKPGVRP